jgi:calcium-dependent protein kinase
MPSEKNLEGCQMSDIRKLVCEVINFTLLPDQILITELRKEFEKLDVEQNRVISLENLKKVLMANAAGSGSYYFTEDEVEAIFNSMRLHK